jgi:uncharacterized membrane protein YfhO
MQKIEIKNQQWINYLYTVLLTAMITIFAFWANKVYPFGTFSVASGDMINTTWPMISRFQDFFFGNSSMFYDFSAGAGSNMFPSSLASNPFSYILLFFGQDNLFLSMSVITLIKVILCSFTSAVCLTYCFKSLDCLWVSLLSTMYATSGFMMFSYYILSWIDVMIIFPLIVIGLEQIFFKKKALIYIITLTLSFFISFYTTILAIILTFMFSGVILFLIKDKKEVKQD